MVEIILSEGFDWPPHYVYSGRRDADTNAAICVWDGTELTEVEEAIVKDSEQSPTERNWLRALFSGQKIPEELKGMSRDDLAIRKWLVSDKGIEWHAYQ